MSVRNPESEDEKERKQQYGGGSQQGGVGTSGGIRIGVSNSRRKVRGTRSRISGWDTREMSRNVSKYVPRVRAQGPGDTRNSGK